MKASLLLFTLIQTNLIITENKILQFLTNYNIKDSQRNVFSWLKYEKAPPVCQIIIYWFCYVLKR